MALVIAAQRVPVIGYLCFGSATSPLLLAALRKGLADTGHIQGKNVAVEYRWANNALDANVNLTPYLGNAISS